MKKRLWALAAVSLFATVCTHAQMVSLAPIATLDVPRYMGVWYQVALYPNRFQSQCVSDTTAMYRALPQGNVEVVNRCRNAEGKIEVAEGLAMPVGLLNGTSLAPAQLRVSFLPSWVRWLPMGWGRYWVVQLPEDYRYAVVSEPGREYLWILSRTPALTAADDAAIRQRLVAQGFDLSRLQLHPHSPARGTDP